MNSDQRGYTLIELMISLLLGLMLFAGFSSLFLQLQKSSTIQRSLSYMMDDGRYVLEIVGREFRRAGFLRSKLDVNGSGNSVFTADANVLGSSISFLANEHIRGEYNASGFGATADQPFNINRLALRYQLNNKFELAVNDPSSTNSPCTKDVLLSAADDPATEVHVVTLYFYVAIDTASNAPVLYCMAKRQNLTTNSTTTSAAEPLISNVQQLFLAYGVDSDADGMANYYVGAGSIGNGGQPTWQQVVAAKLSVVLRSSDDNLTQASTPFVIDGASYQVTDKRLYRVFSTTIASRN